jgi:ubiquinone/menaquinone biosynthesis C-methylase UbiE
MLCEIHDPYTRELLSRAGAGAGHKLLEVGCGLGYVSRWAAKQGLHVTGLDLSDDHLAEARRLAELEGLHNIEWRNANIYDPGLPEKSFDYTYARAVLIHLSRPIDAMRELFRLLKPGALLVCEEPVCDSHYSEPPAEVYKRLSALLQVFSASRKVDYNGGQRLHTWAVEAGFEILEIRAYQPHYLTGPHKGFWTWSFEAAGPALVMDGVLTQEDWQKTLIALRAVDSDPTVLVGGYRIHQLIARRPGAVLPNSG